MKKAIVILVIVFGVIAIPAIYLFEDVHELGILVSKELIGLEPAKCVLYFKLLEGAVIKKESDNLNLLLLTNVNLSKNPILLFNPNLLENRSKKS